MNTEISLYDPSMGIAFIPGTFPTNIVQNFLKENAGLQDWPRGKINEMYRAYKDTITIHKQKPYAKGQQGITTREFYQKKFGFPEVEAKLFLYSIYKLVQDGKIKPYFLNFIEPKSGTVKHAIIKTAKGAAGGLDKYLKTLKWVSIAGVIGVGLYFAWPVLTKGRKVLKARVK